MELNRRSFIVLSATAAAAASLPCYSSAEDSGVSSVPWHQKIRRAGQVNLTEHDPAVINVEEWADYWASLKTDVVMVSVTGIIAYYPTKVPFHRKSKFLNDRDLTGELTAAAKKRNIRVIARFSPDLNWGDALEAHPEWFRRDKHRNPVPAEEEPLLFHTCIFTTYMTEHMPALMREVNSRYPVDGLFTNAWPDIGPPPECYCDACKDLPRYDTPAYWDKYTERVIYLWKMWDSLAKEKGSDNLFFANMGGAIRSGPNMIALKGVAQWYNCDNQGRGGEEEPIWGCTLQGRVCNAIMDGHTATNVTASYSTGKPRWRNIHKSTEEAQMWMSETVASGMVPWYHFIGAEEGLGADRRWQQPGYEFFNWLAKHDSHLTNKSTIADIAVVMGQRTQRFYRYKELGDPMMSIHGIYLALLEGRFLFDFLHEEDLLTGKLKKYKTLLLPNIALLSDAECVALKGFSQSGGSILASFETSLYDEKNERRKDFGIADSFGIHATGERRTRVGNGFMGRIERKHPILDGFTDTDWLPGAQWLQPTAAVENPVMTVIPPFVNYPPELAYPPVEKTDMPELVAREVGDSRFVYFAGDIERTAWQSGNTDLSRLLQNAIRWVSKGDAPVKIEGKGLIETFAWETKAGYALHVLNYTNPGAFKGWIREYYPIG
ncbi:MAG TPA: alpha-amylase family protein, partial [Acidobacteriaceae bacterium]